ncbi:D-alanyl-D-alanine carboxypeptidase family protein [Oryzobacter sp. R7]|uniref:D-alanyl-D-alanine carboxypeptidase family protein n=1 Tax=Oryzobacter faecalis TaxID=3388656 RepID=UPI00398C8F51
MRRATPPRAATLVVAASLAAVLAAPSVLAEEPEPSPTPTPRGDLVVPVPTSEPAPTTTSTPRPTVTTPDTDDPDPHPSSHAEPDHDEPLSGTFLRSQIAEAARITAALNASTSQVAAATREMDRLADQSNALLERLQAAQDTEAAATEEASRARADLVLLESRLARARAVLREWVFSVYSGGGGESDLAGMLDAMLAEPEDVGDPLGDLSYLTEQRTRALQDVRVLTAEQVRLSAAADAAETRARDARATIQREKAALDKVVLAQRAKVADLRKLQVAEVERAGPIANILVGARTPEARAAAAALRDALAAASYDITAIGKPCTGDTAVYPNGMYPASALCPLWGAPGERLAPQAAAAFNALSKAYAAQTGVPLCVTDSYRSYAEQVTVKAKRGSFAATPGTSRHGLGRALDLCGGVQRFDSPAHRWMKQNGPLYGWFHPSWAAAGGSLPEPWHFEFAG